MRKRVLQIAVASMVLLGMGFAAMPFLFSLRPSAKAYAELPRVALPPLAPNSYAYVEDPLASPQLPSAILVVKRGDGTLNLWWVPTAEGGHRLPERHWDNNWGYICRDLSPDFVSETIYCKDSDVPDWIGHHHRWSLDGEALSGERRIPDMEPIPGVRKFGDFVLFHPGSR
jgi:hypothetical protein